MDRNEVILAGRLPEAAHIRSLPSGSRLGTWRLIVRRRHRGRGARVDTIPCASFELEVIEAVAGWLPDDIVEVTGSLRRRWWGSEGAKSSGYEVEVCSARRLERRVTTILTGDEGVPVPAPPRPVRSLLHAGQEDTEQGDTGQGDVGQGDVGQGDAVQESPGQGNIERGAEPWLTPGKPDLISAGPALAPTRSDVTSAGETDPAPVGPDSVAPGPVSVPVGRPDSVPVGLDSGPVGQGLTPTGRGAAPAGPEAPAPAPSDIAPEGVPVLVPRAAEASISGRSRMPHLTTRADAVSGAGA